MSRFVDSQSKVRYELADSDDWVEFRSELSFSENQAIESGALKGKVDQTSRELDVDIDWAAYGVVRLAYWIADWSFADADGLREPPSKLSIARLNQATAAELSDLLDRHVEARAGDEGKGPSVEDS